MAREKIANHQYFETIIIGAGINGAGIFRDLSLHGREVLLIDRGDFCDQTSSKSSKMLHGGIRYLEQLDFSLVKEALQEKNIWLKLAPKLCYESEFLIPIFKDSPRSLFEISMGLKLYDFLSGYQNSSHQVLSQKKVLSYLPGIRTEGLRGAGLYYDGVVNDKKLGVACIQDALRSSIATAMSHTQLISLKNEDHYYQLLLKKDDQSELNLKAKYVVFCTGPFTDELLPSLKIPWESKMLLSKGSHLWLRPEALPIKRPFVIQDNLNRVIFVIPQSDKILVGTTEVKHDKDLFNQQITLEEIEYLMVNLKKYFPTFSMDRSLIISSFAGVRPLVREKSGQIDRGKTSRHHHIYEPLENCFVLLGGKYTTFRTMAGDVARKVLARENQTHNKNLTIAPLLD
jgi:glycerol-3-phosphate dehydrogenase